MSAGRQQIVESKFRRRVVGILFIDEAYSLVEDNRTYGAEAINTIVQEMENYRDEVIVIFAGYPEKMKEFLEQNEGLASRIAFHLNFPDYSPVELTQILDLMLEKSEYRMDERTREKMLFHLRRCLSGRKLRQWTVCQKPAGPRYHAPGRPPHSGTSEWYAGKRGGLSSDGGRFRDDRSEKETAEPADRILCRLNSIKKSAKKN